MSECRFVRNQRGIGANSRLTENASVIAAGFRWTLSSSALAAILLVPAGRSFAAQISGDFPEACSPANLEVSTTVAGLVFRSYRDKSDGTACVQVLRGGKLLVQDSIGNDGYYTLGQRPDPETGRNVPPIANGTDLTGRGRPDMIITSFSGGLCCSSTSIYELRPALRLLAKMDGGFFSDLDHRHYDYHTSEETFAGWPGSYDDSPVVNVILRFRNEGSRSGYHLALDAMHKPAPTPQEWAQQLATARATFTHDRGAWFAGPTLWQPVLQLIYTGHADLAWKFLDEAWPASIPEKDQWIYGFCSLLRRSPYWPDLKSTIGHPPPACLAPEP